MIKSALLLLTTLVLLAFLSVEINSFNNKAKVELNVCGEGWHLLDPSQMPEDQLPAELQGKQDQFSMQICVRKSTQGNGI
jgi:hypothetical protein